MAVTTGRKKTKQKKCKVPGCQNKATSKGNCPTCRHAFLAMIERAEKIKGQLVTEEWLVSQGLTETPKRKGRPAKSAAARAVDLLRK